MTVILILFTTWSLWQINLGHCAGVTVRPEINYENATSCTEEAFSLHFRTFIAGIYKQSFDNFNEIVHLSEISDDVNFKADVLLGLYDAMNKAHHTDVPFYAIDLYNKIEAVLNVNNTILYPAKSNELLRILEVLRLNTIVPKGSLILESAVYVKGFNLRDTPFEKMLKMLLTTNQTVANQTFCAMVARARWTLPIAELTPILANFSPNKNQNIELLRLLYDEGPFQEVEENTISRYLALLEKKLDHAETITTVSESKMRVNTTMPLESQVRDLLAGTVCFYQKLPTGKKRYIRHCEDSNLMCFYEEDNFVAYYGKFRKGTAVFITELKENSLRFTFRSPYFGNRGMSTLSGYSYVFNLQRCTEWKVQPKDEQVVIQDMESLWYLCADNADEHHVHIRDQYYLLSYKDECKWFVENCSDSGY